MKTIKEIKEMCENMNDCKGCIALDEETNLCIFYDTPDNCDLRKFKGGKGWQNK